AAENAAATGKVDSFIWSVPKGVSANLCDAIVGMARNAERNRDLEFDFTWSRGRPLSSDVQPPKKVIIPSDAMPVIEEAGRFFKETSPREDFEVRGPVLRLEREG